MGCSGSTLVVEPHGMNKSSALAKKDGEEEILLEIPQDTKITGWPYQTGRLREVDFKSIIEQG